MTEAAATLDLLAESHLLRKDKVAGFCVYC